MSQPILTIAIPTYNRSKHLDVLLNSIFVYNKGNELDIEVLIFNNCSTDNTEETVSKYTNKGYKLKYYLNEQPLNGNLNINQCYYKANGKYVLCCGDDDAFGANSLIEITKFLEKTDVGVLHLRVQPLVNDNYTKVKKNLKFQLVENKKKLLRKINNNITFISSNIIKCPNKANLINQPDYLDFYQLPVILTAIEQNEKNYVLNDKVIFASPFNSGDYDLIKVFDKNLFEVIRRCNTITESFKKLATKTLDESLLLSFWPYQLYNLRINNNFSKTHESMPEFDIDKSKNIFYRLIVRKIYYAPLKIARIFKAIAMALSYVKLR